jgi:hypothetical protein
MKKLFLIAALAGTVLLGTSCDSETTCVCTTYDVEDDGTKTQTNEETRVIDDKDADCSQFDEYNDNTIGNDTCIECEEKVFD